MSLSSVLRQWWVVVGTVVGAVVVSVVLSVLATPTYRVSSSYIIAPGEQVTETEAIVRTFDSLQGQGIVPTLLEIFNSASLHREVSAAVGLSPVQSEQYEVSANVLSQSNTMELTVSGPDDETATDFNALLGARAAATFEELYPVYRVSVLDEAEMPDGPASPNPLRDAFLAAVLGLLVGTGIAALRARSRAGGARVPQGPAEYSGDTRPRRRPSGFV